MKIVQSIKILLQLSMLCFAVQAYAETVTPPQQIVINVSSELREALRTNHDLIQANPRKELFNIVKQIVLPYADIDHMVGVVLGRAGHLDWVKASKETRQEFVDQFVILTVGTYSAALQEYDDQPVKVFPVRAFSPGDTTAEVHSVLVRDNGQEIQLLYSLQKEGNDWKVTDFSVEGISLIQSYQEQFQSIVESQGLTGLISVLKKHNEGNNDN